MYGTMLSFLGLPFGKETRASEKVFVFAWKI